MKIRGVHMINHGSRKGSRKVAEEIEKSGVLKDGDGWSGHGVYAHYVENEKAYKDAPAVFFEAEVEQIKNIPATTGDFFMIPSDKSVKIKIVKFQNLG